VTLIVLSISTAAVVVLVHPLPLMFVPLYMKQKANDSQRTACMLTAVIVKTAVDIVRYNCWLIDHCLYMLSCAIIAAHLERLKAKVARVTVCVDLVAASGKCNASPIQINSYRYTSSLHKIMIRPHAVHGTEWSLHRARCRTHVSVWYATTSARSCLCFSTVAMWASADVLAVGAVRWAVCCVEVWALMWRVSTATQ
jgi:hypothetical protein